MIFKCFFLKFYSNLFRLLPFLLIFCLSFKCIGGLLWGKERYEPKILANVFDIKHCLFFIAGICGRRHVSGDEQQRPYPPWLCPPHSQDFKTDEDQGNFNLSFSRLLYDWPILQMGRSVPPRPIIAGEPLLTMRSVSSLDELAPWFTTLSLSLTRQQTRSMSTTKTRADTSRYVCNGQKWEKCLHFFLDHLWTQ